MFAQAQAEAQTQALAASQQWQQEQPLSSWIGDQQPAAPAEGVKSVIKESSGAVSFSRVAKSRRSHSKAAKENSSPLSQPKRSLSAKILYRQAHRDAFKQRH